MSQFERGSPTTSYARRGGRPLDSLVGPGVTESLNAPGLEIVPPVAPVPPGVQKDEAFLKAIGVGAVLTREAQIRESENAEAQRIDRGHGAYIAETKRADLARQVLEGKIFPPEGMAAEEWAGQISESLAPEGATPAFREGLQRSLVPSLLDAWTKRAHDLGEAGAKEATAFLAADAQHADADHLPLLLNDYRTKVRPGATELEAASAVAVPAMIAASRDPMGGDRLEAVVKGANLEALVPGLVAEARRDLADARRREEALNAADAERRVWESIAGGTATPAVLQLIDKEHGEGVLAPADAVRLKSFAVGKAQRDYADDLGGRVFRRELDAASLEARLNEATRRTPDDPQYIDPDRAEALRSRVVEVRQRDLAREDVVAALTGAGGYLIPSKHGAALDDVLRMGGLIDQTGRVAQPDALAAALLTARMVPKGTGETLVQNLTGSDATDSAAAARAIGAIGASSPKLLADLLDVAGPRLEPAVSLAVDSFQRGRGAPSAQTIRDLIATNEAKPAKPAAEVVADLKTSKIDPSAVVEKILDDTRDKYPHAKDTALGFDFLNPDPTLQGAGADVRALAERWFTDRYTQLRDRLPREKALEQAEAYARARVENGVDYVRWGDAVTPVLVDRGRGLKLPDNLRWSDGFESEARRDLSAAGIDPDDVAAVRPYLDPPTAPGVDPASRLGWSFVNAAGDTITDAQGRALVFRPSDQLAKRAADYRALLDSKAAAYVAPAERKRLESTLMGTRGMDPRIQQLIKR